LPKNDEMRNPLVYLRTIIAMSSQTIITPQETMPKCG